LDGSQPFHCSTVPGVVPVSERPLSGLLLKPIKGARRTIVILSLALAGCRGPVVPISPSPEVVSIRLLADSATAPLLRDLASSYHPATIVIAWNIEVGEISTVLDWLKTSEAPFALIDYLPAGGFDSTLWSTPVGQDGIAIIVHPSNTIANLTAAQLRAILQGRTANWKLLGGTDLPLVVVTRNDGSSAANLIQTMVLGDRQVTRAARLATTDQAVIDIVASDPGAIGYVSMSYLTSSVRAVPLDGILATPDTLAANQYPIRTPILFAGLHAPDNDAYRAFFGWVQSPDGQAIVRRHYAGLAAP
jgi:phosphate transport system substrate-binding protein